MSGDPEPEIATDEALPPASPPEVDPEALDEVSPSLPPKVDPETLQLRARPPRAIRFRRGVVVALSALASGCVVATAWVSLRPAAIQRAAQNDDRSDPGKASRETLSALPTSYADAPKLGPALPGDLGKPILDRQHALAPAPGSAQVAADEESDRDRAMAALRQARSSPLMAATNRSGADIGGQSSAAPADAAGKNEPSGAVERRVSDRGHSVAPGSATDRESSVNPHALTPAPSPFTLSAGSVIAASLITGLRSDLPGLVAAQITEPVYDSATGRILLIPQGARLIGSYDSVVAFGQRRALVVWQRIIMPDGSSIALDNVPATDPAGYAGLADKVDFHTWTLLKGAALSTLLGVGSNLTFTGGSDLVQAIRESTEQNLSHAGDQLTSRNLQIRPTITIRPGTPVRLVVHHDLVLKPWQETR